MDKMEALELEFQFTHPGRGATTRGLRQTPRASSFNSRTPGGVRQRYATLISAPDLVSIHAPREGCDSRMSPNPAITRFQFTHPGRGATW